MGLIGVGKDAAQVVRELTSRVDCRPLLIRHDDTTAWAWLGHQHRLDPGAIADALASIDAGKALFALGESAQGLAGWRPTHCQALAAVPIAQRSAALVVRYSDVVLLASALCDDLLATSLRQLYLAPLDHERDGGEASRKTLHAYFSADRNITSAAAILNVNRNTVAYRLRAIEEAIGRPLSSCIGELEAAIRLDGFCGPPSIASPNPG